MTIRSIFLHSEAFGRHHAYEGYPWIHSRSDATVALCQKNHLLDHGWMEVRRPEKAEMDVLKTYHTAEYLGKLELADQGQLDDSMSAFGLGTLECPVYEGCLDYHRLIVGSTLMGAEALVANEALSVAFAPTGGMHHAGPGFASGFCYLNDPVIGILYLIELGYRIVYVDIDAHHGDMVQQAFYGDDRVLNISFHESPNTLFPHHTGFMEELGQGAGEGFNVNVPLPAGTGDEAFVWTFERIVPPLVETFNPDLWVTVLGADALASDPMSNLKLTTEGYCEAIRLIKKKASKILALGCGGYAIDSLSRAWTLAWAILNEIPLGDDAELLYSGVFRGDGLLSLQDRPVFITEETRRIAMQECERVVRFIETHHLSSVKRG